MPPKWDPKRLSRKHRKRTGKDAGCFEDLLGITGRKMTQNEYEIRCDDAHDKSWAEFEAECRDITHGGFHPPAAYFVDDELVVAITDPFRHDFITCYHEHFDKPHVGKAVAPSVGQRQLEFRKKLLEWEQTEFMINVERKRGV